MAHVSIHNKGPGQDGPTNYYTGDNDWQPSTWTKNGTGGITNEPDGGDSAVGPNLGCPALPILPETASKNTILTTTINNMVPVYVVAPSSISACKPARGQSVRIGRVVGHASRSNAGGIATRLQHALHEEGYCPDDGWAEQLE